MAQAIYREWFVHFRYPGHEDVVLVDSALGPIPDGWEVRESWSMRADVGFGSKSRRRLSMLGSTRCIRDVRSRWRQLATSATWSARTAKRVVDRRRRLGEDCDRSVGTLGPVGDACWTSI